jgi:hypothetical protein
LLKTSKLNQLVRSAVSHCQEFILARFTALQVKKVAGVVGIALRAPVAKNKPYLLRYRGEALRLPSVIYAK